MSYASSAFFKIGKKRKNIARFLSTVFEVYFPGGEGFVYKKMPGRKDSLRSEQYRLLFKISNCSSTLFESLLSIVFQINLS